MEERLLELLAEIFSAAAEEVRARRAAGRPAPDGASDEAILGYARRRGGVVTTRDLMRAHLCCSGAEARRRLAALAAAGFGDLSLRRPAGGLGRPSWVFALAARREV